MSKLGKKPIQIPDNTKIKVETAELGIPSVRMSLIAIFSEKIISIIKYPY